MKVFKFVITGMAIVVFLWTLSSCEQSIAVESAVNGDGSVDRTITFVKGDSNLVTTNLYGISPNTGWQLEVIPTRQINADEDKNKKDFILRKHFSSVDEMNSEMNSEVDTVFKIKSSFEKKFRWFYTYIKYSDTYLPINRWDKVKPSDYFTEEDYSFIRRLPAEGKQISKADSVYLLKLNEKIYDHFFMRGYFEDMFERMVSSISDPESKHWADTLVKLKEEMFFALSREQNDDKSLDSPKRFFEAHNIPLNIVSADLLNDSDSLSNSRSTFFLAASNAKINHVIKMPWTVVNSNADSLAGNLLAWQPPSVKFMITDYTMYAEARQMNYWAVILSATVVSITILAFVRIKTKRTDG
jgi:hypothetical protein